MNDAPHSSRLGRLWESVKSELNFYRVHLIYFTFTPLIFSAIFYASNGRYRVSYIDALFNCVSAMTVCGLATVNLSSLTGWQQTILFLLMNFGNPVFVSWFMVLIRRYYFARKFEHILASEAARGLSLSTHDVEEPRPHWRHRITTFLRPGRKLAVVAEESSDESKSDQNVKRGTVRRLRPDMIRRMDDAPKPVNPSGWVTDEKAPSLRKAPTIRSRESKNWDDDHEPNDHNGVSSLKPSREDLDDSPEVASPGRLRRRLSDPAIFSRSHSPTAHTQTVANGGKITSFPRHQTIEFAPTVQRARGRPEQSRISESGSASIQLENMNQTSDLRSIRRPSLRQHYTLNTHATHNTTHTTHTQLTIKSAKHRGFGGFPTPYAIISSAINRFFPKFKRQLTRTVTIPVTTSLVSTRAGQQAPSNAKVVPYISFNAVVGRNSVFHLLTNEELEEIGGVEYRALNALLWIVAGYHLGVQLLSFAVIAPYMSMERWSSTFLPPTQVRPVPPAWFSIFQIVSAYTNTGTSLVDQSMVPFQKAYVLIVFMVFLILAGNCAYPIFLRLMIWIITKFIPRHSRLNETLHFLLDHPRRCYTYLFPSHQTWFLLTVILFLTFADWFFFMVLDIGNSVIEQIPLGTRFAAGLLQAVAVRAAGFGIVPLSALAPAVKVLYTVMMYISIYPVAMSMRSTNVYEEQSLGIFKDRDEEEEEQFEPAGPRMHVWSRYLAMHARRQLAFDMWWLCSALFLVCILERHNINDPSSDSWFNTFTIIFEIVSAYGTVGLSLGIPGQNYSLSGAFRPLSKLIICVVMLRGRHRGLPVAIDRAILLPSEFNRPGSTDETPISEHDKRSQTQASHRTGVGHISDTRQSRPNSLYDGEDRMESHVQRRRSARRTSVASSLGAIRSTSDAQGPLFSSNQVSSVERP